MVKIIPASVSNMSVTFDFNDEIYFSFFSLYFFSISAAYILFNIIKENRPMAHGEINTDRPL